MSFFNWKKTVTEYTLAKPAELQTFTINDSDGDLFEYIQLNDSKNRTRSLTQDFKGDKFFEKENKRNDMKCNTKKASV